MAFVPARGMHTRLPEGLADLDRDFIWTRRDSFGPWLRALRERAGYSLRAAATHLGVTFTQLQKMETGGRYKAPPLTLLADIGALYRVSPTEVFTQAGIRIVEFEDLARQVDFEAAFQALLLHPPLCPAGVDAPWLDFFSPLQKQQWVDFARALERRILAEGPILGAILILGPPRTLAGEGATPLDLGFSGEVVDGRRLVDGFLYSWRFEPSFGPWLRAHREHRELALRQVSRDLDLSFTTLQRLETGEHDRPTVDLLERLAVHLGIPLALLFERAGYVRKPLQAHFGVQDADRDFAALLLHPTLRPVRMDPRAIAAWAPLQKRQLVEFAHLLQTWILNDAGRLDDLFDEEE